jgi:thiol-disulfide isomerase/thioredoxin
MKKFINLLAMLSFILITACSKPDGYDSQNKPIRLNDYQGKWLFINYWAAWCEPCIIEMPELNRFYLNNKNQVMVLGVNYDKASNEELAKVAERYHLNYPLLSNLLNPEADKHDLSVLPATLVFNPQGQFIKVLYGPQTQASLIKIIKS